MLDLRPILVAQRKLYKMFNMIRCAEGKLLLDQEERLYVLKDFYLRVEKLRNIKAFTLELENVEKKLKRHLTGDCMDCFYQGEVCGICKKTNDLIYEFEVEKVRFCHICDVEECYSHTACFESAKHQAHRDFT